MTIKAADIDPWRPLENTETEIARKRRRQGKARQEGKGTKYMRVGKYYKRGRWRRGKETDIEKKRREKGN